MSLLHFIAVRSLEFSTTDTIIVFGHCSKGCQRAAEEAIASRKERTRSQRLCALDAKWRSFNPTHDTAIPEPCARTYATMRRHLEECYGPSSAPNVTGVPGMTWDEASGVELPQVLWPTQHDAAAGTPVQHLRWHDKAVKHGTELSAGGAVGWGQTESGLHFVSNSVFVHTGYGVCMTLVLLFWDRDGNCVDCYWCVRITADVVAMARTTMDRQDVILSSSSDILSDLVCVDSSEDSRRASVSSPRCVLSSASLRRFCFRDHAKVVGLPASSTFCDQPSERCAQFIRLAVAGGGSACFSKVLQHIAREYLDPIAAGVSALCCQLYRQTELEEQLTTPKGIWTRPTGTSEVVPVNHHDAWDHRMQHFERLVRRNWDRGLDQLWLFGNVPVGALIPFAPASLLRQTAAAL